MMMNQMMDMINFLKKYAKYRLSLFN